jgi:ribosome-associated protein
MKKVSKKHRQKSGREVAIFAARAALEKKAEDLVILNVRGICSFADYFVIMSGRSTRHVQGLADAVDKALRDKKLKSTNTEGLQEGMWVLLDYDDVVVHIFYHETRSFYNLEGLWHDGRIIDLEDDPSTKAKVVGEKVQK